MPAQLDKQIVDDATKSPFYAAVREDAGMRCPRRSRHGCRRRRARRSWTRSCRRTRACSRFVEKEYLPRCRDTVGIWDTPGGEQWYAEPDALVHDDGPDRRPDPRTRPAGSRAHSRRDADGDRTHRIQGQLRGVPDLPAHRPAVPLRRSAGAAAGVQRPWRSASTRCCRSISAACRACRTACGRFPRRSRPTRRRRITRAGAGRPPRRLSTTSTCTSPRSGPKYEIPVLTIHEAVPGHHLQIALAQELGDLPKFRRDFEATAFVEGWGLYSESLGEEMGLYADPYDKFGQLTYEMWRAVRLVVDTGMHAQAAGRGSRPSIFSRPTPPRPNSTSSTRSTATSPTPGQALAYKIGELRIKELRARSRRSARPAIRPAGIPRRRARQRRNSARRAVGQRAPLAGRDESGGGRRGASKIRGCC